MTVTSIDWYLTAATLRSAFTLDHRSDGSEFWRFTDEARQSVDDLATFVHELHDEELPNDWRYEKIVEICEAIAEYDADTEWSDAAHEITDGLVSVFTFELTEWIADYGSRLSYCDQVLEDGLISADARMYDRLIVGQYECIKQMVDMIMSKLGLFN